MKKTLLLIVLLSLYQTTKAQQDSVIMHINGKSVLKSEFEYNYNKNNSEDVLERKSVEEYVDLFINYKLKVCSALDSRLDTLSSFRKEFRMYRDQQIRPMLVPRENIEKECQAYYQRILQSLGGKELIQPAHIFLRLPQTASEQDIKDGKTRIDSIYNALKGGADFAELAKKHSQDAQTAVRGGLLPWIGPNQTLKEFEDAAYSLQVGEYSAPILSTVGYHIIKLQGKKPLESYEELKSNIHRYLSSQGLEEKLESNVLDSLVKESDSLKTVDEILDEQTERLCAENQDLKYLIQEYHDGLLLFEECSRRVWEPASKDTLGLERYFKKNKKKYAWKEPRFRGLVYYCKDKKDVKAVKKLVKKIKNEEEWTQAIREEFNKDSVTVRMERKLFKQGDNPNVDALILKVKGAEEKPMKGYPYIAYIGKKLKKGPSEWTDISTQVISDYQKQCEEAFVQELRKKYKVEVHEEVLEKVNKH